MYCVYILYSEKDKGLYVGCTSNLEKRLVKHNSGKVLATSYRKPLTCIYSENHSSKGDAYSRERYLKTLWSARFKDKIKNEFLKNRQSK